MINLLLFSLTAEAVPLQVTQQGRMLDANGIGIQGLELVAFRVFDDPSGGNMLWEDYITLDFSNGYYAAVLGSDAQNNPLDSAVLSLYPLYLELQLGTNQPMTPRTEIRSVPYAQLAGIAESIDGGTVNASEVSINGNAVIDGNGTWVGQPLTVDWSNLQGIPSDIADGDSNTQLSETQVEGYITNDAIDFHPNTTMNGSGLLTQADTLTPDWSNLTNRPTGLDDGDDDSLATLGCTQGEIVGWDGLNWVCTSDNSLSESEVEAYITNGGVNLDASSTIGGQDFLTSTDETLSGLNCLDGEIPRWDGVSNLWTCAADTMGSLNCNDGEITRYDAAQGTWICTNIQSLFDSDGDGVAAWADCDDNDPNQLSNANDSDCDGTPSADDCNDYDPNSNTTAIDGDCDGVLTADDCNDNDSSLLAQSDDNDCDGTLTLNDCNDNDPNSNTVATDADCDGYVTADDCDDNDANINPNATEINDGVDNDCDGLVDNTIPYNMDGIYFVSVDTYQGDFNTGGGFCTQMVGQTAYVVQHGVSMNGSYPSGIWQGNGSGYGAGTNCNLYSSSSSSHSGYGDQGGYGSCAQYRHVVCTTDPNRCNSNCSEWD
ncbi:MAG: MopE-related protein [Myxococcota bacterium]|nr:MopE-related protein [Myxococcota bacterium]